jgi:predicted Zn-dependent peptidase
MPAASPTVRTLAGNGLRVVELPVSGRLATSISIAFAAGARHELADEVGAAHLLEHMVFKGTATRPSAREISRAAERLGTELNAYTNEDYVAFESFVRAESAVDVAELLADLCARPLLDPALLDGERAVVLQELADEDEDPSTLADHRLFAALFPGHRLGTRVAGDPPDVERLTPADLAAFRERQWGTAAGAVVLAGNLDHVDRARLDELLMAIPAREPAPPPAPIAPFAPRLEVAARDSEVAHLRLAYDVAGLDLAGVRDRALADVFSALLGGPMGSRLFEQLREERSLCYAVDGYVWGHPQRSLLSVDVSLQADRLAEAYELVGAIVADLREHGPTAEEAERARAYTAGTSALHFDTISARAEFALEALMEYGGADVDPLAYLAAIEAVTQADIAELAARIGSQPCVGCAGPVDPAVFGAPAADRARLGACAPAATS